MVHLKTILAKLEQGSSLTEPEMASAMKEIMAGKVPEEEIIRFLSLLKEKGEVEAEILGAARVLREFMVKVAVNTDNLVDTCGTGGDEKGTFNISTASAFVVAGAGVRVAKHGNRSVSSKCGSADVLEALGVRIDVEPVTVRKALQEAGIGFFFAPRFHPAMRQVAAARKKVGRSIFNLLGPMINPTEPPCQIVGVFDRKRQFTYARVLNALGVKSAWVVHGEDGLDEITLTGKTFVTELKEGKISEWSLNPVDYGLSICRPGDLKGNEAAGNAILLRGLLEGYLSPLRDAVLLNAAAALVVVGRVKTIEEGLMLARHSIDQGKALAALKKLIEITNG